MNDNEEFDGEVYSGPSDDVPRHKNGVQDTLEDDDDSE